MKRIPSTVTALLSLKTTPRTMQQKLGIHMIIAALAMSLSDATGSQLTCYQGWRFWQGSCFKLFSSSSSWNDAQLECERNGGNLAELAGKQAQDFILSLLHSSSEIWLGLYLEKNGSWKWRGGTAVKLGYMPSLTGSKTLGDRCGALSSRFNGSLSTHSCNKQLEFVCEGVPVDCTSKVSSSLYPERNHCYWISTPLESGTWPNVRSQCYSKNFDLALFSSTSTFTVTSHLMYNVSYWVGLQAQPMAFQPIWLDGVPEPTTNHTFSVHKPTNKITGSGCLCGSILLDQLGKLHWSLDDCLTPKSFICEKIFPKPTQAPLVTTTVTQSTQHDASTTRKGIHDSRFVMRLVHGQSPHAQRRNRNTVERADNVMNLVPARTTSPAPYCCYMLTNTRRSTLKCSRSTELSLATPPFPPCSGFAFESISTTSATSFNPLFNKGTVSIPVRPGSTTLSPSQRTLNQSAPAVTGSVMTSPMTFLDPSQQLTRLNENIRTLCPNVSNAMACLSDFVQQEDIDSVSLSDIMYDMYNLVQLLAKTEHSSNAREMFEHFFQVVNFLIEGSYRVHLEKFNMSLNDVITNVEPFLKRHIDDLDIKDKVENKYSHVEILLQRRTEDFDGFEFKGMAGLGNINEVEFGNQTEGLLSNDTTIAVVLMKVPVHDVTLVNRNSTGLVISPIISLSAYNKGRQLSLVHSFTLERKTEAVNNYHFLENLNHTVKETCAFLDKKTRVWSSYGCQTTSSSRTTTACHCNHTTNFAIIMQVNYFELSPTDKFMLDIITYIGCSVALITQVFAITVFTFVGSLNSERVYVHRNLCIAIVAAQVTFLAGIDAVQNRLVCAVVAVALHYCYTAVFTWMLVEGLHLYSKVVQVFGTERSRAIYYLAFGWGAPVILVTISAATDWNGYGTDYSCWLSTERKTIWAFVGPALAIIIVNLVILFIVVKIVMSSVKLEKHGEYDHIRAGIKGALVLLPLLGLTWLFGLVAVNQHLVVFQYLFAIFNSLQGFFIFLFHCAFNGEVRQALRRLRERRSLQKADLSLSSGSHSSSSQSVSPSHAWAVKPNRKRKDRRSNQVSPLTTRGTTTTRLNSLTKESDGSESPVSFKDDSEELTLMYI